MKKYLLLLILLPHLTSVMAQGWQPAGARSNALGNASVTLSDVWSYHHNPGALGEIESLSFGASYENRFLLKELQTQTIAVAVPLKVGVISFGAQLYGYNLYRSQKAGVGYSMKLAEKLYAGVQLNYNGLQLSENYGTHHGMTAEVGLKAYINEQWSVGMSVYNLGRTKLSAYQDDRYTTMFRLGTGYSISKKVTILGEATKNLDYPIEVKGGVEYEAINNFHVRIGASTNPTEFTFGFGYKWKKIQLDVASAYHTTLGWSPGITFVFINE